MSTPDQNYGDLVFRATHPGNLAGIGALFGVAPPALESCRVLELGCGSGFNLLAMSRSIPGGRFLGIDLSENHIRHGQAAAAAIGADNVELRCLSIDDFDAPPEETFDYIIAHGVFSWVPAATRQSILSIIERHLAPAGIAYISYNANPGWRLRGLVRDAFQYAANPAEPIDPQIPRLRQALDHLASAAPNPDSTFSRTFRAEWDNARANPDYYLAHEYFCHPETKEFYFEEFRGLAASRNLQYLAEARLPANSFLQDRALRAQLDQAGDELIRREQHLDWLVGRYFRQTLLCRAALPLAPAPDPNAILELSAASLAEIVDSAEASIRIRLQDGGEYEIGDVGYRAVLEQLQPAGERPVPVSALREPVLAALDRAGQAGSAKIPGVAGPMVAALLWSGIADGVWTVRAGSPAAAASPGERPAACPLARLQSASQPECTNRMHRSVLLDADQRALLPLLDGTHTAAQLAARTGKTEDDIRKQLDRLAALALLTP